MMYLLFLMVLVCGEMLNVHVIPQSHIDTGWLYTYEEYYPIAKKIFLNVIKSIDESKNRTFVLSEMCYIQEFFDDNTVPQEMKTKMKEYVTSGNLEIALGGWVMPDEGIVTYSSAIEDITLGHESVIKIFGKKYLPKVQWRIDSFGHSSVITELFHDMGMKRAVLHRIGKITESKKRKEKSMDFVWEVAPKKKVLTTGLDFQYCFEEPFSKWFGVEKEGDWGFKNRVDKLVEHVNSRYESHKTGNVILPFGCDCTFNDDQFSYRFQILEPIVEYINKRPDIYDMSIKYSTPTRYFDEVEEYFDKNKDIKKPTYSGDFLTYTQLGVGGDDWWTGYYSSWPMIKEYENRLENSLRNVNLFFTTTYHRISKSSAEIRKQFFEDIYPKFFSVWDVFNIISHHDAITGTSKKKVMEDYLKLAKNSLKDGNKALSNIFSQLISSKFQTVFGNRKRFSFEVVNDEVIEYKPGFIPPSKDISSNEYIAFVLVNSLSWKREEMVHIPLGNDWNFRTFPCIIDSSGKSVKSQYSNGFIHFVGKIPALGYSTYFLHSCKTTLPTKTSTRKNEKFSSSFLGNIGTELEFDTNGRIIKFDSIELKQTFRKYISKHEPGQHNSGAYVFRTENENSELIGDPNKKNSPLSFISEGELVTEVKQSIDFYLDQTLRIMSTPSSGQYLELSIHSGPIPDNFEIVTELCIPKIQSSEIVFSLNGFREKKVEEFPKSDYIAKKFLPLVSKGSIGDKNCRLSVITSQGHAMASLEKGCIQIMLHRAPTKDDWKGMGEGLHLAQDVVRGKMRVFLEDKEINEEFLSNSQMEKKSLELKYPLIILGSTKEFVKRLDLVKHGNIVWEGQFAMDEEWSSNNYHLESLQSMFHDITEPNLSKRSLGTLLRVRCLDGYCDENVMKIGGKSFKHFKFNNLREVQGNGIELPQGDSFIKESRIVSFLGNFEFDGTDTKIKGEPEIIPKPEPKEEEEEIVDVARFKFDEEFITIISVLVVIIFAFCVVVVVIGIGFIILYFLSSKRREQEVDYLNLKDFDSEEDSSDALTSDSDTNQIIDDIGLRDDK